MALALAALGCDESPLLGETRCDYPLAECAQAPLTRLAGSDGTFPRAFDVRPEARVQPQLVHELPGCETLPIGCARIADLLPTERADEAWVVHGALADAGADEPWLERLSVDGGVREVVPRGAAMLGAANDVALTDSQGGVALFRDQELAIDDGQPHRRSVPQLFVHTAAGEDQQRDLESIAHGNGGLRYVSPALFPDGSLRLREVDPVDEAPTSLRVISLDRSGALQWRQQLSPKRSETPLDPTALEIAQENRPMDVAVALPDGHYGVLAEVQRSFERAIAFVVVDAAGRYVDAIKTFEDDIAEARVGSLATNAAGRFAFGVSSVGDHAASMLLLSGAYADADDAASLRGRSTVGRRVAYYAVDGGGLALDADGASYTTAFVGDVDHPQPIVCKVPADDAPPRCVALELCADTGKQLLAPSLALNYTYGGGDGVTLLVPEPDVVWTRIGYGCTDPAYAAALARMSVFDVFSDPEAFGSLNARIAWHDQIVRIDMRATQPYDTRESAP